MRKLLRKDNPLVLEIGAYIGTDTQKFLDVFQNIQLYCFEPDPRCVEKLRRTIVDKRCTIIEAAVSNNDGKTDLSISSGWPPIHIGTVKFLGCSYSLRVQLPQFLLRALNKEWLASSSIKKSVSHSDAWPWLTFRTKKLQVETITLDSWIRDIGIQLVDFIWSDVQGAEKDVIDGAVNTLKRTRYIYLEYGETSTYPDALTRKETIDLLNAHDFEPVEEYCEISAIGNLLFRNRILEVS